MEVVIVEQSSLNVWPQKSCLYWIASKCRYWADQINLSQFKQLTNLNQGPVLASLFPFQAYQDCYILKKK